jgi:hypothetical protein
VRSSFFFQPSILVEESNNRISKHFLAISVPQ